MQFDLEIRRIGRFGRRKWTLRTKPEGKFVAHGTSLSWRGGMRDMERTIHLVRLANDPSRP